MKKKNGDCRSQLLELENFFREKAALEIESISVETDPSLKEEKKIKSSELISEEIQKEAGAKVNDASRQKVGKFNENYQEQVLAS
jgi:hypothetical protein